jgi:hypothetical protein
VNSLRAVHLFLLGIRWELSGGWRHPVSKFVGARSHVRNQKLMVVQLTLSTGECFPCLVDDATWLPVTLATRWAVTTTISGGSLRPCATNKLPDRENPPAKYSQCSMQKACCHLILISRVIITRVLTSQMSGQYWGLHCLVKTDTSPFRS